MNGWMRLTGYEIVPDDAQGMVERAYAQTWHLQPVETQDRALLENAWARLERVCNEHGVPHEAVRGAWLGR